ncbi:MAG: glutamate--tRNA ligase [Pseudomonadota bacterium]
MGIVTRFAPSPTGFLHIGSARTALFNWLYAQHHNGIFLVRIEDTDRVRSTQEAIDAIDVSLSWLGIKSDQPTYFQSQHAERHQQVALDLLEKGKAYKCYCTAEELQARRAEAKAQKRPPGYDGRCRDAGDQDRPFVVRFKSPREGETVVKDLVQGEVKVGNKQLDDMILLRSDNSPTYMLSVVVDDHDMGVTHVLRGDDHLTNTFRQFQLYQAVGWTAPEFGHIPLIHGSDGAKLSKRHGALGVEAYRDMGLLPEALCNYLLRLGWAHGDDEIITRTQAIEWFDLSGIGKSAARFDMDKLLYLNGLYLRECKEEKLLECVKSFITQDIDAQGLQRLTKGMPGLKVRAKTLKELAESSAIYLETGPVPINEKAQKLLTDEARSHIKSFVKKLNDLEPWTEEALDAAAREYAESIDLKLGKLAQPLRAALTGSNVSPSIFEVMQVLGREESVARIEAASQA